MITETEKTTKAMKPFLADFRSVLLKPLDARFSAQLDFAISASDYAIFVHHRGVCVGIAIAAYEMGLFEREEMNHILTSLTRMNYAWKEKEA